LHCSTNQLTFLDLSNNNQLREFNCGNNKITFLGLSNNNQLREFNCFYNPVTDFNFLRQLKTEKLEKLYLDQNSLTELKSVLQPGENITNPIKLLQNYQTYHSQREEREFSTAELITSQLQPGN
jgi:hypothetical protein